MNDFPSCVFVTGNRGKQAEIERLLGYRPEFAAIDLPEIQSLDLEEVLREKGREAWRRVGRPVVVEETGFYLEAMGGFPGPLVKWMLEAMGPEGIARAAHALGDPRAEARCGLLYSSGGKELVAMGSVSGEVILEPRGSHGFGWDPVFVPDGETRTYAEIPGTEKDLTGHRGRAWQKLLTML